MEHLDWRLVILFSALIVTACLTGAGIYEQTVLDTAWPRKPSIVRPAEGGANRKLFWVPANAVAVAVLLLAVVAAWPVVSARNAALVAIGFFAVINLVTIIYFGPAVLRVEKSLPAPNDPTKEGSFIVRLKAPAGYKVMPHTHPTAERLTVISRTLNLGMGEKFDKKTTKKMKPGDFAVLPPGMAHFVWSSGESVTQIQSEGPFQINYVNPADDPRDAKK